MSYTPTNWKSGDIVSAEKLNHMEDGIAEAQSGSAEPLIVTAVSFVTQGNTKTLTLDKTWQEVHDALENRIPCYIDCCPRTGRNLCGQTEAEFVGLFQMRPIISAWTSVGGASPYYGLDIVGDSCEIDDIEDPSVNMTLSAVCDDSGK